MDGPALSRAASAVTAIELSADMDALREIVRTFAGPLGYNTFVLYTAPSPGDDPDAIVEDLLLVEGEWFESSELGSKAYLARCPVNRHVLETEHPFFWTKTGKPAHESYRFGQPRGGGMHGLQVPVFGAAGLTGAMSFAGSRIDTSAEARLALTLVANAALHTAKRLAAPATDAAVPSLSKRELEVIRWIASGRRQADIALQLKLSERTVEGHLRRIRNRLGAASTAQAIYLLVRTGKIEA